MDRRIVINGDDFGLCEGVNKAISQAHTNGVLTSATLMTNMPAAIEAVKIAKQLPTLGVGVHLNLTSGRPVSKSTDIDCLINSEGQFAYSPVKLAALSIVSHRVRKAIRIELSAQIQWVLDNGLTPTHLDSHKHFHSFPAIFPIVCDLARKFNINSVRYVFEPKKVSQTPWPLPAEIGRKIARTIRPMARINQLQDPHLLKNNILLGLAHTGNIDVSFFKAVSLYNSAPIAEVMTHPGLPEGLEQVQTRLLHQRKLELEALCSEKTKKYLRNGGIKLVHYGQL